MKDYNKALQSFSQACSRKIAAAGKTHYNLGNTLYQQGETEKATQKKLRQLGRRAPALRGNSQGGTAKQERKRQRPVRQKEDRGAKEKAGTKAAANTIPVALTLAAKGPEERSKTRQQESATKRRTSSRRTSSRRTNNSNRRTGTVQAKGRRSENKQAVSDANADSYAQSGSTRPRAQRRARVRALPRVKAQARRREKSPHGDIAELLRPPMANKSGASPTPRRRRNSHRPPRAPQIKTAAKTASKPSPTPAGTPGKPTDWRSQRRGRRKTEGQTPGRGKPAEAEPEKEGEMSAKQAAALLESMKDEEQKVQLDEHKSRASCL